MTAASSRVIRWIAVSLIGLAHVAQPAEARASDDPVVIGRVVDAWDHPYADALVEISGEPVTRTNAVGVFRFSVRRAGSYIVGASHEDALLGLTADARVMCERGRVATVEVYLPRAARVGGRVVVEKSYPIETGIPLRDAAVFVEYEVIGPDGLELQLAKTWSDSRGRFLIRGAQAAGRVRAWAELADWAGTEGVLTTDAGWENLDLRMHHWPGWSLRAVIGEPREVHMQGVLRDEPASAPPSGGFFADLARARDPRKLDSSRVDVIGLVTPVADLAVDLPVVTLRCVDADAAALATLATLTRRDGSFAFVGVPRGCYVVRARTFEHLSEPFELDLANGSIAQIHVPMQRVFRVKIDGLARAASIERAAFVQPDATLRDAKLLRTLNWPWVLVDVAAGTHRIRFDLARDTHSPWMDILDEVDLPPLKSTVECTIDVREGGANTLQLPSRR